ncbi:MAG TPA: hypothetical protein VMV89_01955 [Candidatus Paceibacterota bacterium]|nr:hypothetical protein [Candidatus Paceibacterota bacterium]
MNRRIDNDDLLVDVLSGTEPADFRDALLGETLRLVRRRRRWRQMRQSAGVFAVAGLLAVLGWQNWPEPIAVSPPVAKMAAPTPYKLVRTEPLPDNDIVTTRSFLENQLISSSSNVVQVETAGGGYRQINDAQLLALVAQRPAVLIRTGPHSEELVFANPEDKKGFPLN